MAGIKLDEYLNVGFFISAALGAIVGYFVIYWMQKSGYIPVVQNQPVT